MKRLFVLIMAFMIVVFLWAAVSLVPIMKGGADRVGKSTIWPTVVNIDIAKKE